MPNNKNLILAIVAILIVALVFIIYWQSKSGAPGITGSDNTLEEAVTPPSANPLESVAPSANPVEKTNPFKYENPFE